MYKRVLAGMLLVAGSISVVRAEEAVDPQLLFDEAMVLRDKGEIFTSIEVFELILNKQPGLQRARLELAVAYHQARRFYDARDQLMKVFNDPDTPESVKLTITAYLAQLASDEKALGNRTSSTVYVSTGLFSDSNINLRPDAELTSLNNADQAGSYGVVAMASYSHVSRATGPFIINKKPVDMSWHSQATAYSKMYVGDKTAEIINDENDYNLQVLSVTTGPALVSHKDWRSAFNVSLDKVYFGGTPYAFNVGLNPSFTLIFDDIEVMLENLTTVREYDSDEGLGGVSKMYGVGLTHFLARQTMAVEAGVRYHNNGANAQHLHSTGIELYLGGQMPAWQNARAYVQLGKRDYGYKAEDSEQGFSEARDETETRAILGVTHDFKTGLLKSWGLNAQWAHTDNNSNLSEFDYDRDVLEVNLRRYFY